MKARRHYCDTHLLAGGDYRGVSRGVDWLSHGLVIEQHLLRLFEALRLLRFLVGGGAARGGAEQKEKKKDAGGRAKREARNIIYTRFSLWDAGEL